MTKKFTTEEFIWRARKIHGDKYDYSKVVYVNNMTKVCIVCPVHGEFWQRPKLHLRGHGCPCCSVDLRTGSVAIFISKAKEVHGDKYDYSQVIYRGSNTKVTIVCPKHGEFSQKSSGHLSGRGCPFCSLEEQKKGVYGKGVYDAPLKTPSTQSEKIWRGIMGRGYSDVIKNRAKSYTDVSVSEQWYSFECFKKWFDEHYVEGWHLDKDLLVKGNKVYGPDTCCFIPKQINSSIHSSRTTRGEYPIGVTIDKRTGRFIAKIQIGKKQHYLGCFDTINEAFNAYKIERERHLRHLADKWKDQLDPKVYDALYHYKVEITD